MARRTIKAQAPDLSAVTPAAEKTTEIRLKLRVVTPILGGGVRDRELDQVDLIRAPSIRGQLRFWWRALYGHKYPTPQKLYEAESAIWGGVAKPTGCEPGTEARKSCVAVVVEEVSTVRSRIDETPIQLFDKRDGTRKTEGAYALFSAREQKARPAAGRAPARPGVLTAARRLPGTTFRIKLRVLGNSDEVRRACAAWVAFGGVGARTRRGLSTFDLIEGPDDIKALVLDLSKQVGGTNETPRDFPMLDGAKLFLGKRQHDDAAAAWLDALEWLSEFRQGVGVGRDPGSTRTRPGRSRWPEPDVVRSYNGARPGEECFAHVVRYGGRVAYPRAQFGLPLITEWQTQRADKTPYVPGEPGRGYELNLVGFDRLSSPVIVKPFKAANGRWVACALWLQRKAPRAQVGIRDQNPPNANLKFQIKPNSGASVNEMPDTDTLAELKGHSNVRDAFFAWLERKSGGGPR
jgi:CRISPR-associated protein Cmr1